MAKNSQIRDSTAIQYVAGAESFFVLVVLSRVALWAAILSNVDKARWAFAQLSEPGAWSPTLIAVALELALAVTAYGLAEARRRQQPTLALWGFTGLFAAMSAIANIAYFTQHAVVSNSILAWLFGLAAPAIALANGALAGITAGQKLAEEDANADQAFQVRMAELEVEQARQQRLATNAAARLEKAKVAVATLPQPTSKVPELSGNQATTWQAFLEAHPDMLEMTGKRIAELAGVSERTGNNWKQYARAAGNGSRA